MTSPVSPSETIAKAMEGVTPPDKLHVVFSTWKEDGSINIRRWSTFMEFDGSTAYIAEASVNAVTKERDALALQLEAMQREMAEKDDRIAALEAGLKPFADEAAGWSDAYPDSCLARTSKSNLGDLRRARTLIQGEKK